MMTGNTPDWHQGGAAHQQTASPGANQRRHHTAVFLRRMLALCGIVLLGFSCSAIGIASAADAVGASNATDAITVSGNASSAGETYGADPNPTGNPIGGGAGYSDIFTQSNTQVDYVVTTLDELQAALSTATAGDVIFIPSNVTIDTSSVQSGLTIPAGVTVASDRGYNGSPGGRIYHPRSSDWGTSSHAVALKAGGDNARVTGVRLEGTDTMVSPRSQPMSGGIVSDGYRVLVDNCEISGFSYFGVSASSGASNYSYIHHNHIHHCQISGYGYGVLNGGTTLVEANRFQYMRHAIADGGSASHFYEARYNVFEPPNTHHLLDMHGEGRPNCGSMYVHHNTFKDTSKPAVRLRSVPMETAYIDHNWFWKNGASVQQKSGNGNIVNSQNMIGSAQEVQDTSPIDLVATSAHPIPGKTSIAKTPCPTPLSSLDPVTHAANVAATGAAGPAPSLNQTTTQTLVPAPAATTVAAAAP